jgi:hypothetical protein
MKHMIQKGRKKHPQKSASVGVKRQAQDGKVADTREVKQGGRKMV